MTGYPAPPWRLRGSGLHSVCLIPVERARPFVPPELRIVCPLPGHTLGGIFAGRYGPDSTLEYSELIVVPALVRRRTPNRPLDHAHLRRQRTFHARRPRDLGPAEGAGRVRLARGRSYRSPSGAARYRRRISGALPSVSR